MIYIVCLLIASGVLALDLISKSIVESVKIDKVIIPELLKFKLRYNKGASFSFLADKEWARTLFIITTSVIVVLMLVAFIYLIVKKKKLSTWLFIALSLIFGGALGNLYDRIFIGEVRDFIFVFYNTNIFPAIFNVADMGLVIGVIMVCVHLLFLDKDAIFRNKEKETNAN